MSKKWMSACLLLALLAGMGSAALAQAISFPYAGVRLQADAEWTVLTPDTLDAQTPLLEQMDADIDVLRGDYAANHTVFEAYLPEGIQVALTAVQTEDSRAWQSVAQMREADKETLTAAFGRAPYEDAGWSDRQPGYFQYHWTVQAGGIPVTFACLLTVQQGALYTLTASGADVPIEALQEANETLLERLTFLGNDMDAATAVTGQASVPAPIPDDGIQTPMALEGFDVITYVDTTEIVIRTLPGAEVQLRTQTDTLRGKASEEGLHRFQVSTRRETVYQYTLRASIEGRTASEMAISVERQLTAEEQDAAYRRSARTIDNYGYGNLVATPEKYAGTAVTFRGLVGDTAELLGFPCVLVYTENPGRGSWRSPMWVMLTEPVQLAMDDICTVYGDLRGDTMAYTGENGEALQAPVIISRDITE